MTAFLEIVFPAGSLRAAGIMGRDELEDPIDEALIEADLGDVSGGGSGIYGTNIDVEINDAKNLDEALRVIIKVLRDENAPTNTEIIVSEPTQATYTPLAE